MRPGGALEKERNVIHPSQPARPCRLRNKTPTSTHLAGWRERFHAYLGGASRTLDVIPEAVGGVADHVHLLLGLKATHCLADIMRDIKRISSSWVHETIDDKEFEWQDGYGAFSVSASLMETVKRYIAKQEEHHRRKTFQEEYVELLGRSGVAYDERYLW